MAQNRFAWLGQPWFLGAVALLALNDHVLKYVWPGFITGKLSDFAGLVVVGTLGSVVLGRSWGLALSGLGFVMLKTVPGVAELAAPILGGVTLRDPSDLLALTVLPLVWFRLGRTPDRAQRRRGWQLVGLVGAVLATTATSPSAPNAVEQLGYQGDAFFAQVYRYDLEDTRWLRSTDGGATWEHTADPTLAAEEQAILDGDACAADGVCYRTRTLPDGGHSWIERDDPSTGVTQDSPYLQRLFDKSGLAINPHDSRQVTVYNQGTSLFYYRAGAGDWRAVNLVELANDPQWIQRLLAVLGSPLTLLGFGAIVAAVGAWLAPRPWAKPIFLVIAIVSVWWLLLPNLLSANRIRAELHLKWLAVAAVVLAALGVWRTLDNRQRPRPR